MIAVSGGFVVTGGNPLLLQLWQPGVKPIHEKSAANPPPGSLGAGLGSFRNPPNFRPFPANPRPARPNPFSGPPEPPPPRTERGRRVLFLGHPAHGMIAVSGGFVVNGGNLLLLQLCQPGVKPIYEKSAAKPPLGSLDAGLGSFRNPAIFLPPPVNPRPMRDRLGLTLFPGRLSHLRPAPIRPPLGPGSVRKRPQVCRGKPMLVVPSPSGRSGQVPRGICCSPDAKQIPRPALRASE